MAELILVRHGQASYGADDYDRLSELGWQQSRWLGEHFVERGIAFDLVVHGTLRRHAETAEGILQAMGTGMGGAVAQDAGLNEYDAHALLAARYGSADLARQDADRRKHFRMLRDAMYDWTDGKLPGDAHEPFIDFRTRVMGALQALQAGDAARRVLVVTSGGPISTFVSTATGMPARMMVDLNLQTRNAGYSEFRATARGIQMVSFNNVPHLDRPDRAGAVTYA